MDRHPLIGHPLLQGKCSRPGGVVGCAAGGWGSPRLLAACRDLYTSPLRHASERSREVCVWGCLSSQKVATWLKAWSAKPPVVSLRCRPGHELPVQKRLQHPGQGLSASSSSAPNRMSISDCVTAPTDILQKQAPGKKSWLAGKKLHFLTNAAMEEDGWKHMRNIFVWSRKQMPFLQLPQKTGMKSSLPIGTVVPRNAAGENRRNSHSLAEAFSGRRDTTAFMPGLHAAKNWAHGWNKYSAGREGGGNIFSRSPNRYEELLLTVMEVESWY